jgi:hypothetical protein
MPLTSKGRKIMRAMKSEYGADKGERVFYASRNKGTISGVDPESRKKKTKKKKTEEMTTTLNIGGSGSRTLPPSRPKLRLKPKAALPLRKKKKTPPEKVVRNYTGREGEEDAKNRVMKMVYEYEKANGLPLTEEPGGLPGNTPGGTYKPYAPGGGLANKPSPVGKPDSSNQIKITAGPDTWVVTYVDASKGWCIYQQQGGAGKAQFKQGPLRTLKDAMAAVAVYF